MADPLPVEVLAQIAAAAHPVNRRSMRLSRQYLAAAMPEATAEETIAAMLQVALREYALRPHARSYYEKTFVYLFCHCPPGPVGMFEFMPRNRNRFNVTYSGRISQLPQMRLPSQRFRDPQNILLSANATVHDAISLLQAIGCRPSEVHLKQTHNRRVRRFFLYNGLRNRTHDDE